MLLEVKKVHKNYETGFFWKNKIQAVKNVSFSIAQGDIFGLIGESGCGKTTMARIIAGLLPVSSGSVFYNGLDLTKAKKKEWYFLRKEIQIIFQHPQLTFHPQKNLYFSCAEPIRLYHLDKTKTEKEMINHMIQRIGFSQEELKKYPHEISGGQAQRLSIIRCLCLNPKFLICDEPTSMLDVSVQAQILNLLKEAQLERNLTILYISHDLEVVQSICNRIAVMHHGKIIETGDTKEVMKNPKEEYTKQLLSANLIL